MKDLVLFIAFTFAVGFCTVNGWFILNNKLAKENDYYTAAHNENKACHKKVMYYLKFESKLPEPQRDAAMKAQRKTFENRRAYINQQRTARKPL